MYHFYCSVFSFFRYHVCEIRWKSPKSRHRRMFSYYHATPLYSDKVWVIETLPLYGSPLLFDLLRFYRLLLQRLVAGSMAKCSLKCIWVHNMLGVYTCQCDTSYRFLSDNIYYDTYFPYQLVYADKRPSLNDGTRIILLSWSHWNKMSIATVLGIVTVCQNDFTCTSLYMCPLYSIARHKALDYSKAHD